MTGVLRSEFFRLSRRMMPRILLGLLALTILGFYLLFWSILRTQPQGMNARDIADLRENLRLSSTTQAGLSLVQSIGTVLIVILAVSLVSSEYSWGTLRLMLPRTASREAFLGAKLLTLLLFITVMVLFGFVIALVSSALVTAIEGIDAGSLDVGNALASLVRTGFVMLPYMALAFLLAVWSRSTALGIGVGLAVLFLEPVLAQVLAGVGGPLKNLPDALLGQNTAAVMRANSTSADAAFSNPTADLPSAWRAAAILAAYTVAFLGLAFWRFRTRDITSG